jgi:predicted molibdopterin-dependent oxidoreductase YjgC
MCTGVRIGNMLSSFADAGQVARGLAKMDMVVCVDLFMNETARRFADVVLPGTAWLEELGFKVTNTHLYLMERALEREGETRPVHEILRSLANSLDQAFLLSRSSLESASAAAITELVRPLQHEGRLFRSELLRNDNP